MNALNKYKPARFYAESVHAVESSETYKKEAFASLNELKSLFPGHIEPEKDPDLLYIVANLAVGGLVNRNGDALDIEKALAIYKNFEKKFCDIEHNRKFLIGFILRAGLTERGTDRVISEDEARQSGKPFNITTVAVLWRVVANDLCNYIVESFKNKDGELSLSLEVGFDGYDIIGLPKGSMVVSEQAFRVSEKDARFPMYDACLTINGGSGIKDGCTLARVLSEGVIPLGQGVVGNPAAQVSGILPVETNVDEPMPATKEAAVSPETEPASPNNTHINTEIEVPASDPQISSAPDMTLINLAYHKHHEVILQEISASLSRIQQIYDNLHEISKKK